MNANEFLAAVLRNLGFLSRNSKPVQVRNLEKEAAAYRHEVSAIWYETACLKITSFIE